MILHHKCDRFDVDQAAVTEMINTKDLDGALKTLKGTLESEPSNEEYLTLFGDLLIDMGKHKLLFNFVKRLVENNLVRDETKLKLMNKVGESFSHQNRFSDAVNAFQNVLQFEPNNVTALNNLGFVHFNQNRKREAIEYFNRALEIDPNNDDVIGNLEAMAQL